MSSHSEKSKKVRHGKPSASDVSTAIKALRKLRSGRISADAPGVFVSKDRVVVSLSGPSARAPVSGLGGVLVSTGKSANARKVDLVEVVKKSMSDAERIRKTLRGAPSEEALAFYNEMVRR